MFMPFYVPSIMHYRGYMSIIINYLIWGTLKTKMFAYVWVMSPLCRFQEHLFFPVVFSSLTLSVSFMNGGRNEGGKEGELRRKHSSPQARNQNWVLSLAGYVPVRRKWSIALQRVDSDLWHDVKLWQQTQQKCEFILHYEFLN